jgi:HK97 family phage major capsid protein
MYADSNAEILAIARNLRGKVPDVEQLAERHVQAGSSVDQFRSAALSRLPEIRPMQKPILSDVPVRQWASYSITRAIQGQVSGRLDGFEGEMSRELSNKLGQSPSGFWMPAEAEQRNFVSGTGTLGGYAVATDNLGSEFIELLRNKCLVAQLGARILTLNNPVTIPRQAAAGSTNWCAETVASTLSTGNFEQLTLTPYAITGFQQYSKQLLYTSNPSIDTLVQNDINAQINVTLDRAALHGTGSGQPTGIASTTGIGTVSVAMLAANALGSTLFPFLVSLETSVATNNADGGALAYLMHPKTRAACKTIQKFSTTGSDSVWMGQRDGSGIVNGYTAHATNQIATNLTTGTATTICTAAFFGNWNELLIAQFNGGATDIVIDPYTLAVNGVVRVLARRWVDIGVRHAASFAIGGGILA